MSVETIFKVILHPFINESLASLKSMTNLEGEAGDIFVDKVEDFRFKGYAVCSDIKGSLDGVIIMHHYSETAVAIGNSVCESMLGENHNYQEMNDELSKALAEWGNTIIGRATHVLNKHNLGFDFLSPHCALSLDDMEKYLAGVKQIITVPIHVEGVGRYYFNLLVREVNYNANAKQVHNNETSQGISNTHSTQLPFDSKILLVDDSPLVRKAINKFLVQLGYNNIIEADDGSEAVKLVNSESPDFMFMDIVMERMNGDVALLEIRKTHPDLPIVMLSSVTDQQSVTNCEALGISGFIFKPLNNETGPQTLLDHLKIA
ncbi:response regulator [Colwelliaceae bacterium 6471]